MTTHRKFLAAGLAGLALLATPPIASAAIVMDFSEHAEVKNPMEVLSYSFPRSAPPIAKQCTGAGGGGSVTVTKPVDASSPQLAEASQAKTGAVVMLDETKIDGTRIAYQFTNATISAIAPAGGGDKPMESISFNYTKVQWITVGCQARAPARRDSAPQTSAPSYGGTRY